MKSNDYISSFLKHEENAKPGLQENYSRQLSPSKKLHMKEGSQDNISSFSFLDMGITNLLQEKEATGL